MTDYTYKYIEKTPMTFEEALEAGKNHADYINNLFGKKGCTIQAGIDRVIQMHIEIANEPTWTKEDARKIHRKNRR